MKNPLKINLNTIIKEQERILAFMKATYGGRVTARSLGHKTSRHRIECVEANLRLLRKYKKDPQLDFNAALEQSKKKTPDSVVVQDEDNGDDFYLEGGGYE